MADIGYSIFLEPTDTVRAFRARDQLQPTVRWSEMRHENHASAFTVAKMARLDLLTATRTSLDKTIAEGGSYAEWRANILPQLQREGWWGRVQNEALTGTAEPVFIGERRLRNIYRTNVAMSIAAGNWSRIQRQKSVLPYLRYLASTSEHKRPLHKTWYGTILPVDHPWWQTHFPPNGWGCNCGFQQISAERMARRGWKVTDSPPDDGAHAWHPATGETISVPNGIDDGFGYNTGTAHLRAIANKATESIERAIAAGGAREAEQALREIVADSAFDQFLALPDSRFPVMILGEDVQQLIGSKVRVAVLSLDTMGKQIGKRADLPSEVYRRLPDLPAHADVIALDGDNVLALVKAADGAWTVAILKRTATGEGLFVTSVRQQNEASLRRLLKGKEIVVDRR